VTAAPTRLESEARTAAVRWRWSATDRWRGITAAAAVGLVMTGLLAVFGLPPVDLHPPLHHLGMMDPFCGMTRGVRLFARGDLPGAVSYNPAAPLVPVGGFLLVARHLHGWRTGQWADLRVRWTASLVAVTGTLVTLLWLRQQLNADLLTGG
jgi:hypothetical protein